VDSPSEIAPFNKIQNKKSQILKQQNLASEEGDEKLMELLHSIYLIENQPKFL
jgi:hypothetical protein